MRTRIPTSLAAALALTGALLPGSGVAQIPFQAACDLLDDAAMSAILGIQVEAERESDLSRTQCAYKDDHGDRVLLITLHPDSGLATFAGQQGAREITLSGLPAVSFMGGGAGRVVVELAEGGLLDVGAGLIGERARRQVRLATGVAEAIVAGGLMTAVPPDRGEVEQLYLAAETLMCDALALDEMNTITGASFTSENVRPEGERCYYILPDTSGSVTFSLGSDTVDSRTVDIGSYGSEELTVAGRPAIWEPRLSRLTIDAGPNRLLRVEVGLLEQLDGGSPEALREQAVELAEGVIGGLTTVAPPPPPLPEDCHLTLDEIAQITGLGVDDAQAAGDGSCAYLVSTAPQAGVIVASLEAKDPATLMKDNGVPRDAYSALDVAGRAAVFAQNAQGAAVVVDLDGLPDGDGRVLFVNMGGLPEGTDAQAAGTQIAEMVLSRS
jgi:hypothetical protein